MRRWWLGAGILCVSLACGGGLLDTDDTAHGADALVRFEAKLGSVPDGADQATYFLGGFQDPFVEAELRAQHASAVAWFDALELPCGQVEDVGTARVRKGFDHPDGQKWRRKSCSFDDGTSFTVLLEPEGEHRWVLLSWYTT